MGTIRFVPHANTSPASKTDFCEPHLNLLAHAQALELDIGSRCGGHGICGGDVVQPCYSPGTKPQTLSPLTEAERRHLSPSQIQEGYRLACQCYPESPELDLEVRFKTGP